MMHWSSWQAFWEMGGYAFYVWGSFGATFLLILLEVWQAHASWTQEFENLRDALQIEASLQGMPTPQRHSAVLTPVWDAEATTATATATTTTTTSGETGASTLDTTTP